MSCVKNGTEKQLDRIKYVLKYGLIEVKKVPAQMFNLVLNIPLSLSITLHLGFLKSL